MVTVTTKEGLKKALQSREKSIILKGEIAKTFIKKKKQKRAALIAGASLILVGLGLVPFTGGTSLAAATSGFTAIMGGTTITLGVGELAILAGLISLGLGTLALAVIKEYDIKWEKYSIELTKKEK